MCIVLSCFFRSFPHLFMLSSCYLWLQFSLPPLAWKSPPDAALGVKDVFLVFMVYLVGSPVGLQTLVILLFSATWSYFNAFYMQLLPFGGHIILILMYIAELSGSWCYALTMLKNDYILLLLTLFQCAYNQVRINCMMVNIFIIPRCHSPLFCFQAVVKHCLCACCGTYRLLKTKEHPLQYSCPSCIKFFWY